jgi:AbrB family looped-hinge helix DNA binding protein
VRFKVRLGSKGQLVIPKIVRDSVGLRENKGALLEVKEGVVEIRPLDGEELVAKSKERAKKHGGDIRKLGWIYGDKLYEEVFSSE